MSDSITNLEKRQDRIEDAIEKLTIISGDLNKILAVHEHRLSDHDRVITNIEDTMERRREEADIKLQNVYDRFKEGDRNILEEINNLRSEANEQHEKLSTKIAHIERTIWTYLGGFSVFVFVITYGPSFLDFFKK